MTPDEAQRCSEATAALVAQTSDRVAMQVFRLDYARIETLLWLSESRDLDQSAADLVRRPRLWQTSTKSNSS